MILRLLIAQLWFWLLARPTQPRIRPRPFGPSLPAEIVERFPDAQHARWGMAPATLTIPPIQATPSPTPKIWNLTHPTYECQVGDWKLWRLTYEGGQKYIEAYLKKFSKRETAADFRRRKEVTPIPAFAAAAITEIKNSIFQRTVDVIRADGPATYQQAIQGNLGGVDLKAATMNWFIGHYIIDELLTMKRVGTFVDMKDPGRTIAQKGNRHPYIYRYSTEDILNYEYSKEGDGTEFSKLLLRDFNYTYDSDTGLPIGGEQAFRYFYTAPDGQIIFRHYDKNGEIDNEFPLGIPKIPFVMFEISDSLLKNVATHQLALMNLDSSDVSYALKGNYPFYTEQSKNSDSNILRQAREQFLEDNPGAVDPSCQTAIVDGEETIVGAATGRKYPIGTERPGFINPSAEPLRVSMEKQKQLKEDIRSLVQLALSSLQPKMASAESKKFDQSGLESGLSYIGLELEHGERKIAEYWTMYEGTKITPTVFYPKQWSLKSQDEIKAEINDLKSTRDDIPSLTYKKEINKRIATIALGNSVTTTMLQAIHHEIDLAKAGTSDPKIIESDFNLGLVGQETASGVRGYAPEEVAAAKSDHAERLARISAAQSSPAARGLPDADPDPSLANAEKQGKPQRGAARD